jgi:hypothetical protein
MPPHKRTYLETTIGKRKGRRAVRPSIQKDSHIFSGFLCYTNSYHSNAERCDQEELNAIRDANPNHNHSAQSGPGFKAVLGILLLVAGVLVTGVVVYRRARWSKAADKSAKDADEEDDEQVGAGRGEII